MKPKTKIITLFFLSLALVGIATLLSSCLGYFILLKVDQVRATGYVTNIFLSLRYANIIYWIGLGLATLCILKAVNIFMKIKFPKVDSKLLYRFFYDSIVFWVVFFPVTFVLRLIQGYDKILSMEQVYIGLFLFIVVIFIDGYFLRKKKEMQAQERP